MRYILTTILIIFTSVCSAQFFGLNRNYSEYPYFVDTYTTAQIGSNFFGDSTIQLTYPEEIKRNDRIIIAICNKGILSSSPTISGYTLSHALSEDIMPNFSAYWYWKLADGSETGTITINGLDGSQEATAFIIHFRGVTTATDWKNSNASYIGEMTTALGGLILPTTQENRLSICITAVSKNNQSVQPLTNATIGDMKQVAYASASSTIALHSKQIGETTTFYQMNKTLAEDNYCITFSISLYGREDK